jgi:hypothetical protein
MQLGPNKARGAQMFSWTVDSLTTVDNLSTVVKLSTAVREGPEAKYWRWAIGLAWGL